MSNEKTVQTAAPSVPNLSTEDLVKLVTASVVAALANQPAAAAIPDNLGLVIGDAVAAGMTRNQRRKVTIGEYLARLKAGRPEMARRFFQNNIELLPGDTRITDREIELLNQISRSGRYINRLVEVTVAQDGADEVVHFRYNNRKPDHQFALMAAGVKDFATLLEMVLAAQKVENADEDDQRERMGAPKRRPFGSGKHTRAAEVAAAV